MEDRDSNIKHEAWKNMKENSLWCEEDMGKDMRSDEVLNIEKVQDMRLERKKTRDENQIWKFVT